MYKFTAVVFLALCLAPSILASGQRSRSLRFRGASDSIRTRNITSLVPRQGKVYNLKDMYEGQAFIDQWEFATSDAQHIEPTHGMTNYLRKEDATARGLAKVDGGVFQLAVDDHTPLQEGQFRDSVRISTQKKYNGGLFIADFAAMPYGCSVWPAYWSVGPNWPSGGEIDVLEGVHNQDINQYTLHTSPGCRVEGNPGMTGAIQKGDCAVAGADNTGCGIKDTDGRSYGAGFNGAGGGVYAHLWDKEGIKIWHFARADIPQDIKDKKPNPSSWHQPAAFWPNAQCDVGSHFHDHVLTLNIALCGDWAGTTYANAGCPGTCQSAVANPQTFANAKFRVNYIAAYE